MEISVKDFNSLSTKEIFDMYKLRNQIFIVEQNCAYQDVDDKDLVALHLLIMDNKELVGYSRILPPNTSYKEPSIGRVAIRENYRKKGVGKLLMNRSMEETKLKYKNQAIVISAQLYLLKFYRDLGFYEEGSQYLEDDIPHIKMRLP